MENILPVHTGMGGSTLGALGGAFVGSLFGNGFGGGWGGNWGARNVGAGVADGFSTSLLMDSLTGIRGSVDAMNTAMLQGQCMITAGADRNTAQLLNSNAQGFAGLNTAIVNSGYQTRDAIQAAAAQQASCCCDLKQLIAAEGCANRELQREIQTEALRTQLCDLKAENSSLKQDNKLIQAMQAQTATILAHINSGATKA